MMQELRLGRVHCQCSPATNDYVNDLENALLKAQSLLHAIARDAKPEPCPSGDVRVECDLSPLLWQELACYRHRSPA